MVSFDRAEHSDDGEHTFAVYDCNSPGEGGVVADLAAVVRGLYVDIDHLRTVLTASVSDLATVADVPSIEAAIQRILVAAVPEPGTHKVPRLDVARNELAEAIAHLSLPKIHGTVIPASRIRNKEVSGQPTRGRDLLGLEEEPLTVVIGEVKASDEASNPPGVVSTGTSSMRSQFIGFLQQQDGVLSELNWALKHADATHHALIARALLAHVAGSLRTCVAPVLVGPRELRGADDFGTFRDNPSQFAPACVRFSVFRIDGALDELAKAVYDEARRS